MKQIFLTLILLFLYISSFSATLYSRQNGDWSTNGTWSTVSIGGSSCGCTPGNGDAVIIGNGYNITKTTDITIGNGSPGPVSLTINSGGIFTQNTISNLNVNSSGYLIISGIMNVNNTTFSNGSSVLINNGGILNSSGTFTNNNNSTDIVINGTINISGNANVGSSSTITGSGSIKITGTLSYAGGGTGTIFGGQPSCTNCILPIDLIEFYGKYNDGNINIYWSTASESNNDYFLIEKSYDGVNFIIISKIKGGGNSSLLLKYNITDSNNITENYIYYRLKQVDYNGKTTTYKTISIKSGKKTLVSYNNNSIIITNPVKTFHSIKIYTITGSELYSTNFIGNFINIDIANFDAGLYILIINSTSRHKIIKP